jgi:hypothetical protein
MDTSYCKEQPNMQEDVIRREEVKEEEVESGNSIADSVNSGLDQIAKFIYRLDWPVGEGNV